MHMCPEHARFGILPSSLSPESPSQPSVEAPAERCTSDPHGRPARAQCTCAQTQHNPGYMCSQCTASVHTYSQCTASAHVPKPSIQPWNHLAHHLLICNRRKSHQRRRLCPRWAQLLQNSPLSANFIPRQRQTERACLL